MKLQSIGKSLLLATAGTGMVSFFLMMTIIPTMALLKRLHGNVAQHSEVVNPSAFMRTYGIGLAAAAFAMLFVMAMLRFRREEAA
jgi:ABC-type sulfate transport system permease component